MTELLREVAIYSQYEVLLIMAILIGATLFLAIYSYFLVRDKNLIFSTLLSTPFLIIIAFLTYYGLNQLVEVNFNPTSKLIFYIPALMSFLNLSVFISDYSKEYERQDFDIDHVTRKHFNHSLNLSIVALIAGGAVSPFLPTTLMLTVVTAGIASVLSIAFNHLIIRVLFKEK
jgi:hypothetical protein